MNYLNFAQNTWYISQQASIKEISEKHVESFWLISVKFKISWNQQSEDGKFLPWQD